jgi:uncharacterized protein YkwD
VTAKHRIRKYGNLISCYGENLAVGCITPMEVMLQLLIDDGSKSRGHRNNVLNPDFNYLGCFTGDHKNFGKVTVVDYAAGFVSKDGPDLI